MSAPSGYCEIESTPSIARVDDEYGGTAEIWLKTVIRKRSSAVLLNVEDIEESSSQSCD
jgi:hypothetical protein